MRDDLITVVTGEPRSGTSLQMQSLHLLGVPVAGKAFPVAGGKLDRSAVPAELKKASLQHSQRMNPRGFYEVPGVVMRGVRDITPWAGKAIKIITAGLWPRTLANGMELGTPTALVDKYIFCVRDPKQIAVSQKDLTDRSVLAPAEDGSDWALPQRGVSASVFIERSGPALIWMSSQPQEELDKFLPVDFGEMVADPEPVLRRVMDHIERDCTAGQLLAAVTNVSSGLNRSLSMKEWPDDIADAGRIADQMYAAFRSLDLVDLAAASVSIQEFVASRIHDGAIWVDDEDTWATITAATKRLIMANTNDLATTLRGHLTEYRQNHLICDQCEHYSRYADKTYTVARPADLGPLVRPMVRCGRDNEYKTVEMCKACWQQGSTVAGELLPAQQVAQLESVG